MIDFRYHLVSIVAVFLALAVGIVLGATVLGTPLLHTLRAESSPLPSERAGPEPEADLAQRLHEGGEGVVDAYAEDMLAGRLDGVRVVVVEAPGADSTQRKDVAARIEQAGGVVAGRLLLSGKFTDPDEASFVGGLAVRVSPEEARTEGGPYEKAGAQLAKALLVPAADSAEAAGAAQPGASPPEAAPESGSPRAPAALPEVVPEPSASTGPGGPGPDSDAVLAAYSDAGLVTGAAPEEPADIALLVGPAEPLPTADGNASVLAVARAMSTLSGGAVLAGDTGSAAPGGLVAQARAGETGFSTVDTLGTVAGDVVSVLALAEGLERRSGHYGVADGATRPLPDPVPGPRGAEEGEEGTAEPGVGSD